MSFLFSARTTAVAGLETVTDTFTALRGVAKGGAALTGGFSDWAEDLRDNAAHDRKVRDVHRKKTAVAQIAADVMKARQDIRRQVGHNPEDIAEYNELLREIDIELHGKPVTKLHAAE